MKIPVEDYYRLGDIVRASYPECIVYSPKSPFYNYLAKTYLANKKEASNDLHRKKADGKNR